MSRPYHDHSLPKSPWYYLDTMIHLWILYKTLLYYIFTHSDVGLIKQLVSLDHYVQPNIYLRCWLRLYCISYMYSICQEPEDLA